MNAPKVSFDSDKIAADGSLIKPISKNDRINKLRELATLRKANIEKAKHQASIKATLAEEEAMSDSSMNPSDYDSESDDEVSEESFDFKKKDK